MEKPGRLIGNGIDEGFLVNWSMRNVRTWVAGFDCLEYGDEVTG